MLSKNIEVIDRMNLTQLKAPGAKKGSPKATVSKVDCNSDRTPPVRSSNTFTIEYPSVL